MRNFGQNGLELNEKIIDDVKKFFLRFTVCKTGEKQIDKINFNKFISFTGKRENIYIYIYKKKNE